LLKEKVRIHEASWSCPPNSTAMAFSCRKPPVLTGLHAMTMHVYELDSRIKENLLKKMGSVLLNLFWIDYKITNPTELVSQISKLWTDRYEFSKIEFEFKPKRNRKEFPK
jgi:hypothetical protein